ncbi:hypothetical protein ACTJJB_33005 [Chitinophaga sp. 22536]|uniref:hypothetical protein n=1 Tax=unclassified Chitinophaga TaxID=2619133 RepID=UPI003F865065
MNQDPVFEFSEHFDEAHFYGLFGNDIEDTLILFYEISEHLPGQLNEASFFLTDGNWEGAQYEIHRLRGSLRIMGQYQQDANILQLLMKLRETDVNATEVITTFKQVQLFVFSLLPLINEEIKRIRLYINTHYRS